MDDTVQVIWSPQPGPQLALIHCPVYEILYGGARGGGKTDGVLGKMALKAQQYGAGFNAVFFRHELPMLDDAIARSHQIYTPLGARWADQKKTWVFPGGGRLRFRPLERVQDAEKYQGQNLTDVCIEEAGNFADPAPIMRLHAVLRSAAGVPTQMHLTGNPGGPGQHWLRARYVDPHPNGYKRITERYRVRRQEFKRERVYIPAKVWDNKLLLANDPGYVANLQMVGSDALVRAWLDGDWDAIEGAYFDCWSPRMVIRPVQLPKHWLRFRAFDWGSARPFSVGWWAVASEDFIADGTAIPKNALVRYREWYGCAREDSGASIPNKGLKLTAEEVAVGIAQRTKEEIAYSVADPAIFAEDGGPSIAERMVRSEGKIVFRPADNRRIPGHRGQLGGWDQMRARMKGEDGRPMIYTFDTCADSIRTIPTLQHDADRPEDLDTDAEDHPADEWRYACMSRPYTRPTPTEQEPIRGVNDMTFDELIKAQRPMSKKRRI